VYGCGYFRIKLRKDGHASNSFVKNVVYMLCKRETGLD